MIKIVSADFIKGALKSENYPVTGKPEFAFFGRSNAGKSSLINMIVNRKSLAKTGSRPGMTRVINFFMVNNLFCLADLPGYGYAERSHAENDAFDQMLLEYSQKRFELKTLFFLMDMRRIPGEVEHKTIEHFESMNKEVVIVGTKADKLSKNEVHSVQSKWANIFQRKSEEIIITSSTKNAGHEVLLKMIQDSIN